MDQLLALVVVVPLLVAAAVTVCGPLFRSRRRILDLVAILTAAAVAVMLFVIMIRTTRGDQVYWFAGFRPAHGVSIGIDFEVQPISAGLACLAAVLVTAAMTFSWRYFDQVATYYHALMLTFLAGIAGFCLTGDLFDLFVWFELMGVSAYALTAYRPEERGPIQGALNIAITNSIGAYLSLSGIALIYGRTGALNMAQIGVAIAKHPADRLVVVAFLLVIAGLLIKSAIVPFHFWLPDAHAVAPAEDPQMAREAGEETSETTGGKDRTPLTMLVPPAVLVVAAIAVGLIGPLGPAVQAAAVRFEDQAGYNATVLFGAHVSHPVALFAAGPASVTAAGALTGLGSVVGALILTWLALYWRRLPLLRGHRPNASIAAAARRFQSGVVNDYVTWIVIGLAGLGGIFAAIIGLSLDAEVSPVRRWLRKQHRLLPCGPSTGRRSGWIAARSSRPSLPESRLSTAARERWSGSRASPVSASRLWSPRP